MTSREEKWNQELGVDLSSSFWNSVYDHTANINYDNRMKWLQFQINRNSLYTNYKVNKFNRQVSAMCTFCLQNDPHTQNIELVSHLFVRCEKVNDLWTNVGNWLGSLGLHFTFDRKILLFGDHSQPFTSVSNYIILSVKYYIWVTRIKNQNINLLAYKKYLYYKLKELKNVYRYEKKEYKFNQWLSIFSSLET